MKKLVTAFALAALVATPAFAKTKYPRQPAAPQTAGSAGGYGAYAEANSDNTRYGPAVFSYGAYAGWDPDPNIRLQLIREYPSLQGNGQ
jgi:opacity protein-like surface antigen